LAKLSGLSKQALSNLELGNREPNWNTVQRLAAALGVSCDDFIDPAVTQQTALAGPKTPGRRKDTHIAPVPKGRGRKTQIAPAPPKRPRSRPRKVDRKHHRPTTVEVSV
jgi:transcriptional regulator with XRE-family HTH domain